MLLWFALVTAEPALLHSCPVHSGTSSSHAAAAAEHAEHDFAAGAHASHADAATPAAHESPAHDGDAPEQHRCACIGDCSSGAVITGLPAARPSVVASVQWIVRTSIAPGDAPLVTAPEFLRPYANGPPGGLRIA
jgi:hypothetical protein